MSLRLERAGPLRGDRPGTDANNRCQSIGSVARLKVKGLLFEGEQWVLSFNDKGDNNHKVPVRSDLQLVLRDYMNAAGIDDSDKNAPLFRTAVGKKISSPRPP